MSFLDLDDMKISGNALEGEMRQKASIYVKEFKTSWIELGQVLYAIYQDKMYHTWGYEKFEHYIQKELGIKKELATKLLKTYLFIEETEPAYLKKEYQESRDANRIPGYEAVNVLRLARGKKELLKDDYAQLKRSVFDRGKDASFVRRELTSLIKERKPVDSQAERDERNRAAIQRLVSSLKIFKKDMDALKLVPDGIVVHSKNLLEELENELE